MLMNHFSYYRSLVLLFVGVTFSVIAPAAETEGGLRLTQTRIVFDATMKNAKVTLKNSSQQVYLIKADVMNTPEGNGQDTAPPFIVTPPMSRLEKESQNTLLIVGNGTKTLPTDHESVFYLSFLAIPATTKTDAPASDMTSAQVSVGIRNIIKLFYRPTGLPISVETASGKLTFRQIDRQIEVSNPTPYYLTLAQLSVDKHPVDIREHNPMIAPFSTQTYPIQNAVTQAEWSVITDFGDMSPAHQAPISHGGSR